MSWDVMVFKFAGPPPATADDIDADALLPLGPAAEVRQKISAALPAVDWSDPSWAVFDGDGFSIEFNVGSDDAIKDMMLHVRGGGDGAVASIMSFVTPHGWSALDCSTGDFLNPAAPSAAGWKQFQTYRDQVLGGRDHGGAAADEP